MTSTKQRRPNNTRSRAVPVTVAVLLGLVAIALIVALFSGGPSNDDSDTQTSEVDILGESLLRFDSTAADPTIGEQAPAFTASHFDGTEVTVTPSDGTPRILLFITHWCPHCQAEVRSLTDWFNRNGLPSNVEVIAISTSVDQGAPNYPPSLWLHNANWPAPVVRDSSSSDLASAYGLSGFPYLVAIDGSGNIVRRSSGQLPQGQWQVIVDSLTS